MRVDDKLIRRVAEVARLKLTDSEIKTFEKDFVEILEYFAVLDEVDTKDVELSIQPVKVEDVLRTDKPNKCLTQDQALSNSKDHKKDGFFKGPKAV